MKLKVNSYKRYFWTCSQCDHFYFKPPEKIIFSQTNNTPSDFYLDFLLSKMIWHKNVSKPVNISGRITHKLHVLKMKDQDSSSGNKSIDLQNLHFRAHTCHIDFAENLNI